MAQNKSRDNFEEINRQQGQHRRNKSHLRLNPPTKRPSQTSFDSEVRQMMSQRDRDLYDKLNRMLESELNDCFADKPETLRPKTNRSYREYKRYNEDLPDHEESIIVDIQIVDNGKNRHNQNNTQPSGPSTPISHSRQTNDRDEERQKQLLKARSTQGSPDFGPNTGTYSKTPHNRRYKN